MTCDYEQCAVPERLHDVCAAAGLGKCWGPLQHQHVVKRSQGGRRCEVRLCAGHHGCIDSGHRYEGYRLKNEMVENYAWCAEGEGCTEDSCQPTRTYVIRDRDTGAILVELPIELTEEVSQ